MTKFRLSWTSPDGLFDEEIYRTYAYALEMEREYIREGCKTDIEEIKV